MLPDSIWCTTASQLGNDWVKMAWRIRCDTAPEMTTERTQAANGNKASKRRRRHSEKMQTMLITEAARKQGTSGIVKSCDRVVRCEKNTVAGKSQTTATTMTNWPRRDTSSLTP